VVGSTLPRPARRRRRAVKWVWSLLAGLRATRPVDVDDCAEQFRCPTCLASSPRARDAHRPATTPQLAGSGLTRSLAHIRHHFFVSDRRLCRNAIDALCVLDQGARRVDNTRHWGNTRVLGSKSSDRCFGALPRATIHAGVPNSPPISSLQQFRGGLVTYQAGGQIYVSSRCVKPEASSGTHGTMVPSRWPDATLAHRGRRMASFVWLQPSPGAHPCALHRVRYPVTRDG